jgi:uncharacterized protein (TIGR02301 family)
MRPKSGLRPFLDAAAFWCLFGGPKLLFPSLRFLSTSMLRNSLPLALALCLAAGPAGAQFFPFQQPPQYQYQPRPQPRPQVPAQPKLPPQGQQPQAAVPPPHEQPAPYDRDLQRLSEILGALHFLRGICGANEGQKWRDQAQALIDAEAPTGDRHDQMVASFNRGYHGFQQSYRTCTPAADLAVRRYLEEGASIAREITARYAN